MAAAAIYMASQASEDKKSQKGMNKSVIYSLVIYCFLFASSQSHKLFCVLALQINDSVNYQGIWPCLNICAIVTKAIKVIMEVSNMVLWVHQACDLALHIFTGLMSSPGM